MLTLLPGLSTNCFADNYQSARSHFNDAIRNVISQAADNYHTFTHPLVGPANDKLSCDVLFLGNTNTPQRVLVLISATHGVEGFAGSAIQTDCFPILNNIVLQDKDLGVVFIHALNPWGFAWLRRNDHEGIDLNRNFVDFTTPLPENQEYAAIYQAISQLQLDEQNDIQSLWQENGLQVFTEIITKGQYSHKDGCFYGGSAASWSRQVLEQITQHPMIKNAERMAVIDLHTGLGPYGYGELINDHLPATAGFHWAEKLYGANACAALLGESCSTVKKGLLDYHWHKVMGDRGCFVTLEFGTFALQQLLSTLIKEQLYHCSLDSSGQQRDINNKHVQDLKAFFYPAEKTWQQQVLFRGRQTVAMALDGMQQ